MDTVRDAIIYLTSEINKRFLHVIFYRQKTFTAENLTFLAKMTHLVKAFIIMTIKFSDNIRSSTCQMQALLLLSKLTNLSENPQKSKCFLHIVSF